MGKTDGTNSTQIYLTKHEHERLRRLAARTGRSQSELIRAAVDQWLEQQGTAGCQQVLEEVAGIWRERTDLPDFAAIRREADRQRNPGAA
jgi:predicted DNA-binding protein